MFFSRYLTLILAPVLVVSACAVTPEQATVPQGPPREKAGRPEQLSSAPVPSASETRTTTTTTVTGKGGDDPSKRGGSSGPSSPDEGGDDGSSDSPSDPPSGPPDVPFVALTSGRDDANDHGNGPPYADLWILTLEGSKRHARVVLRFGARVPKRLRKGAVMGVGVDFFRPGNRESDFQIFLDGGPDGWFAYLQTPQGFVDFPGTFVAGGDSFAVTVPWKALGGMKAGEVSAFVDHSDASTNPTRFSQDHLPPSGRLSFQR